MTFPLPDFVRPYLFTYAMTHRSYAKEQGQEGQDNERLEFLGDAILNFLCGEFLYTTFPERAEGDLTRLRASLVDKKQLAQFATTLNLGHHLLLGQSVEQSGGRDNPRLLCSAFEAMVGAYYLDGEGEMEAVRAYVVPWFERAIAQQGSAALTANPKSQFQEWALAQGAGVPTYGIVGESGPDHAKRFMAEVRLQGKVYGQGEGQRKQDAEKAAAQAALNALGIT
jgi:ribonuclease-3